MFRNYLAAAFRNLARNRFYSGISVVGLAVGLCATILAGVTIRNELSYERFIDGYERTYLAAGAAIPTGRAPIYNLESPSFVAAVLKANFREIEAITRIAVADVQLRRAQIAARERLYWADPNAFDLLRLPVLAGDLNTALARPDGIVVTRGIARKYFGRDDPLGQSILLDEAHPMIVAAVIEDLPVNGTLLESGIFASGLAAYSSLTKCDNEAPAMARRGAVALCGRTYLQLSAKTQLERLQPAIDALMARTHPKLPGMKFTVHVIRIDRAHLFDGLYPGMQARIAGTGAVALLILVTACVVFVNLSTARSTRRAREVGIRKACGASRGALILQFLGESWIYVALASAIGLSLAELLLPYANAFLNSAGHLDLLRDPTLIVAAVAGIFIVGAVAGAYPAFLLSQFQPTTVLKGSILSSGGALARQTLVAVQFAILIGLVVAVAVIYQQHLYATHDALRVESDQMLIIRSVCKPALVNELRALPGVRGAYCSAEALLDRMTFCNCRLRDGSPLAIDTTALDFGVFDLYGIKPLAGKLPTTNDEAASSRQSPSQVVINETAARRFGFISPAAALGQALPLTDAVEQLAGFTHASLESSAANQIVAVVPDFSLDTVSHRIRPTFYTAAPYRYNLINVKLTGRNIPETLTAIDRLGIATGAADPVERFFLDEYIQNLYIGVLREAQGLAILSAVALVLASLGLLGLSAATAERRTKEIGIRKAMGAGTGDILRMLLWQFTQPVLWASLVAWPLSALVLNRWLSTFAYHVQLEPWLFPAASALALGIALLTVGSHALLLAREKPVGALRYE